MKHIGSVAHAKHETNTLLEATRLAESNTSSFLPTQMMIEKQLDKASKEKDLTAMAPGVIKIGSASGPQVDLVPETSSTPLKARSQPDHEEYEYHLRERQTAS